jgi:hypothetical protein
LKYKTEKFDVKTRITQLIGYTRDGDVIAKAATPLLPDGLKLRLLGVRMSQLTSSSSSSAGTGNCCRKQRTLSELLLAVECPARKKRKLDDQVLSSSEPDPTTTLRLLFTCPVCHSWRTSDGEVALNSHIDECLNQQVLYPLHQPPRPNSETTTTTTTISLPGSSLQTKLDRYIIRRSSK